MMMSFLKSLLICLLVVLPNFSFAQTVDEYIQKAEAFNQAGQLKEAKQTMETAVQKFPQNATAYSYLGLYTGMQAGRTTNFMEAGQLVNQAFEWLNKAVSLEPNNQWAHFHRGILGVSMPEFLGKLDLGISDLEFVTALSEKSPEQLPQDVQLSAYNVLAQGYQKKKNPEQAILAYQKIIDLAPTSKLAETAQKEITRLSAPPKATTAAKAVPETMEITELKEKVKQQPENTELLTDLGQAYFNAGDFETAQKTLNSAIQLDSTNIRAYKLLFNVLGALAGHGYDEKIYDNTDYRTNLAFELVRLVDKAVALAPEDIELKLLQGITGVQMPFFVGKQEQAIKTLNQVLQSEASDSMKAEALYWLGEAHQRRAMTNWIKVVSEYPQSAAAQNVYQAMRPRVKRMDMSEYQLPFATIDFLLGFRDELPPQTAVWIETTSGKFVKTIYVSGFSGYVKERQVQLSDWADASDFTDVDAVTAASIDVGHHIYVWDLKDHTGKKVDPGEYFVKVEVVYWPSMVNQIVTAKIKIGTKNDRVVVQEGNVIPYLEVATFMK